MCHLVLYTKRENNLPVHITKQLPKNVEAVFTAEINKEARQATAANHTATHLLHEALREVLGTHVEQKGSYVSPQFLRFDFSHFQKMTDEEIQKVERLANKKVREAIALEEFRNMPIAQAKELGAMALFGEKYGEEVRVIKYGSSVELCGGTHVKNTGNIGIIKILSESSIAAGIRRIEAVTGSAVEDIIYDIQSTLKQAAALLNTTNLIQAVEKTINENADLKKEAENVMQERIKATAEKLLAEKDIINGINVCLMTGVRIPDMVKGVAFAIKEKSPSSTIFIGATTYKDKPMLTVMATEDMVKAGFNASAMVKEAAKLIQGGGGGQPQFAQAGGKNAEALSLAIDKLMDIIKNS